MRHFVPAMTTVQITLPDALASEAANAGLLTTETIGALLRDRLRSGRVDRLRSARAQLADQSLAITPAEIVAEIEAYRAERPRAAGS